MATAFAVIMAVCFILLTVRYIMIKHEIRSFTAQLRRTREQSYNRRLTLNFYDRDLSRHAAELNLNQEYQHNLKLQAEHSEEQIRQSVSDMAHDLRTPMTVINGDLQLIMRDESLSDKGREYLRICLEKSDELRKMADDFFELSLFESDSSSAHIDKINIVNTIMDFIADNEAAISVRGIEPEIVLPDKAVYIMADSTMLGRILGNLLNNVLKYAVHSFCLCVRDCGNTCEITFSNKAGYMSLQDTERIFERNFRGDKARSGNGAGLGLYIVRMLAEKQGAKASAAYSSGILSLTVTFKTIKETVVI